VDQEHSGQRSSPRENLFSALPRIDISPPLLVLACSAGSFELTSICSPLLSAQCKADTDCADRSPSSRSPSDYCILIESARARYRREPSSSPSRRDFKIRVRHGRTRLRKLAAQPKEKPYPQLEICRARCRLSCLERDRWETFFGTEIACAICRHGQSQPALDCACRIVSRRRDVNSEFRLDPVRS